MPTAHAVADVVELWRSVQPDTVVTFGPDGMTGHPDHQALWRWTSAAWVATGRRARLLLATTTERFAGTHADIHDRFDVFLDPALPVRTPEADLAVSIEPPEDVLDQKLAALRAQASQTAGLIEAFGEAPLPHVVRPGDLHRRCLCPATTVGPDRAGPRSGWLRKGSTWTPSSRSGRAPSSARAEANEPTGRRVDVVGIDHHVGGRQVLHGISLSIGRGELVALAGGSGAGKTTVLQVMAGLRRPTAGTVLHDGVPVDQTAGGATVGYVPQDDIIHRELPLGRTLRFAAALRLPHGTLDATRSGRPWRRRCTTCISPTGRTWLSVRSRGASASERARRSSSWPVPGCSCWTSRHRASTPRPRRRCSPSSAA